MEKNRGNMWRIVVGDGDVVTARTSAVARMAAGAALLLCLSAGWDVWSNLAPYFSTKVRDSMTGVPARLVPNPREMEAWRSSALARNGRQDQAFGATPAAEFEAFVAEVERDVSLLSGKYACVPMATPAEPWSDPRDGTASRPRCKKSGDGEAVWVATYVLEGMSAKPSIGVFRTEGGRTEYVNLALSLGIGATHRVKSRGSVSPEMVAYRLAKDFPGSAIEADGETKAADTAKEKGRGITQRAKDAWQDWRKGK